MREEIDYAINFICDQFCSGLESGLEGGEGVHDLEMFRDELRQQLEERYTDHWFPSEPERGCGYRCLEWSKRFVDGSIQHAAQKAGLEVATLMAKGPRHLKLWVDPGEVSARINSGSIQVIGSNRASPGQSPRSHSPTNSPPSNASIFYGDQEDWMVGSSNTTSPQSIRGTNSLSPTTSAYSLAVPNGIFGAQHQQSPHHTQQGQLSGQHFLQQQHQQHLHQQQRHRHHAQQLNTSNANSGMFSPPIGRSVSSPFHGSFQQHQLYQQQQHVQHGSNSFVRNKYGGGHGYFS
eukprot:m.12320 g.12320  ORF g.12320 m.12320 type:complete len:291 (-) comp3983_c0_seq1:43-915(-)